MIWETRKASLNSDLGRRGPSPPLAPSPDQQQSQPVSEQSKLGITANHSALTTPSPDIPAASYIVEGEHSLPYNAPSVSSCSSTLSTDSPYSPTVPVSTSNIPLHVQDLKSTVQHPYPTESAHGLIYPDTWSDVAGTYPYPTNNYLQDTKVAYHSVRQEPYMNPDQTANPQSNSGVQAQLFQAGQNQHPYQFSYQPYPT